MSIYKTNMTGKLNILYKSEVANTFLTDADAVMMISLYEKTYLPSIGTRIAHSKWYSCYFMTDLRSSKTYVCNV